MYKQSFYNIWINNILYNSLSDKLICFNDNELESVKYFLDNLSEFQLDYPKLFDDFIKLGFICNADFDEIDFLMFQNKRAVFLDKNYRLTINPTLECNYSCWYCCVEDAGTKYERRRMDDKTIRNVKKHIQYMLEKEHINLLNLDWFGGEPLMYFDEVVYPISIYGMKLCQKNEVLFFNNITTNAYYINENMIKLFNKIKLNSFQIPIDGGEKKHNLVKNTNGVGHYKKIMNNINSLCEKIEGCHIILRINYDLQTLKTVSEVIGDIKEENKDKIVVDFQRVWQVPYNKDESGNNQLLLDTKKLFEKSGFKTRYFAYSPKKYTCCYADNYYHRAINYDGKVYKCTARDYSDDLVLGTLNNDGTIQFNYELLCKMFGDATFRNDKCMTCKKLPLCFGPCIQKYYEIKIGKKPFQCLYEHAEISLEEYIQQRAQTIVNT